jgi:hypothetical protein
MGVYLPWRDKRRIEKPLKVRHIARQRLFYARGVT